MDLLLINWGLGDCADLVGISYIERGDIAISKTPNDIIKTMTLGSCVGVMLHDPVQKIVAMGHIVLPDSSIQSEKALNKPARYADTGVPLLLKVIEKMGSNDPQKIIVKIAGGAQMVDENNTFNIGQRNVLAVKKILSVCGLKPVAEDTGNNIERVMEVLVRTGDVVLSSPGRTKWKL